MLRRYSRRIGLRRGLLTFVAAAIVPVVAQAADVVAPPEPDQVFVVTIAEKDASHPDFGSGSKIGMVIDGVQGKELILTRGKTYAFRVESDVQHDLYLSTSPVGWGAEVLAQGVTGNFTYRGIVTFTPSAASPALAYYQCRNHKSMGGKLHIVNPGEEGKVVIESRVKPAAAAGAAEQSPVSESQIKQKIGFAEIIINQSEAAGRLSQSDNAEAAAMYRQAQDKLSEAKEIAAKGDYAQAMTVVDEALRLMSDASRAAPDASQNGELRTHFAELMKGIKTFEDSYNKKVERLSQDDRKALDQVDLKKNHEMVMQATRLADEGQYVEANKLLVKVQRTLTAALGAMLDKSTIEYDKSFTTPKEEYEYELARYQSYEELIPVAIEQKQPPARALELMDQFVAKAKEIRKQAEQEAGKENYETTIQMLQAATDHLQQALHIAGVR